MAVQEPQEAIFKGSSLTRTTVSIKGCFPLLAAEQARGTGWRPGCPLLYDNPSLMRSLRCRRQRLAIVRRGKWSCFRDILPSAGMMLEVIWLFMSD